MTAPRTAMILAAGKGTRMGALTARTAKPLLHVGGRPLLDHALDRAAEGGAARAVVNIHWCAEQVAAHLAARPAPPETETSDERDALLETGGGVARAAPRLGPAPVFILNSDAVFAGPPPLPLLARAWDAARMDALLLLVPRAAARAYSRAGDFELSPEGRPLRRGAAPTASLVYSGVQIARPGAFAALAAERAAAGEAPAFSANLVWDRLAAAGRLFGAVHPGPWVDVGTPEGLAEADALLSPAARG